jgi:uncharacterized protein (TIGR00730 family)
MKIAVFCSSSNSIEEKFLDLARHSGILLAKKQHTIVFGGAKIGMMGELARSSKKHNGKIIGVAPDFFDKNRHFSESDEFFSTKTMSERKQKMIDLSDAFLVLPGGVGTLDELLDILTIERVQEFSKPIYLLNFDNFFKPFLELFDHLINLNFAEKSDNLRIIKTLDELKTLL